jgi:hypothetical protein
MMLSRTWKVIVLAASCAATGWTSGCQTTIGGQTLPSATYLTDDIQYFPAGPEFQLTNTVQALEDYKASQAELAEDVAP